MSQQVTIKQRSHGSKYNSSHLPSTTPIIGLGCSSFSAFFLNEKETKANTTLKNIHQDNVETILQEELKLFNPLIQSWIETIHYAIENGITLLDTAPWYGHGTSEVIIGFALKKYLNNSIVKNIQRSDLIINTKVGRYDSDPKHQFDFTYQTTIYSIQRSIKRMQCSYIDIIQLHDPEFVQPNIHVLIKETIPALLYCRDELKIVKSIGLTGYPLEVQYHILQKVDKSTLGSSGIVFDQCLTYCHYNLHSQALFDKNIGSMDYVTNDMRKDGSKVSDHQDDNKTIQQMSFGQYCHYKSIPLMAAAPLSMGLLTNTKLSIPIWHPASKELQQACIKAGEIANEYNVDLPTVAMLFALVHKEISCTLLGMANKRQVDVALNVVNRLGDVEYCDEDNDENLRVGIQNALKEILTINEQKVLKMIMDEKNGPFAYVWSNDQCGWDGVHEAEKFWSSLKETMNSEK